MRLSAAMESALAMMEKARERGAEPHGVGANTFDQPYLMDGQVWMDWRTMKALERRGLVTYAHDPGEVADVWLSPVPPSQPKETER